MLDILHSKPANKTAALVVSKGTEYDHYVKSSGAMESDMPLPMLINIPSGSKKEHDITGFRSGRFVVIGRSIRIGSEKTTFRWVAKCDCGTYAIRTRKSVLNESNGDMCSKCRYRETVNQRQRNKISGTDRKRKADK